MVPFQCLLSTQVPVPFRYSPHKLKPIPSFNHFRSVLTPTISTLNNRLTFQPINCGVDDLHLEEEKSIVIQDDLPEGLQRNLMPKHVAIVLDGNRRWAIRKGLQPWFGYKTMFDRITDQYRHCTRLGIPVLTVYVISIDNLSRPKREVEELIIMTENYMGEELENFMKDGVRVSCLGDFLKVPKSLQIAMANVEEATKKNTKVHLLLAVSYDGHNEILQACQKIAYKAKNGSIEPKDIDASLFLQQLQTNCTEFPYPDIFIRTSGVFRVSKYLLWQLAYTELFFIDVLWPDFADKDLVEVLHAFQRRPRRYGKGNLY